MNPNYERAQLPASRNIFAALSDGAFANRIGQDWFNRFHEDDML